jgi:hypothetical protein
MIPTTDEEKGKWDELFRERNVKYTLSYTCPINNSAMQVTLNFKSSASNKFENANVSEVQVI